MLINNFLSPKDSIAAITYEGERVSYNDLVSFASTLYNKINHRCLIFCMCQNSIDSLGGYVSFLTNKVVPLLLDASMDITLLRDLINLYKPEYLWIQTSRTWEFPDEEIVFASKQYSLIKLHFNTGFQIFDDLALLLTTSGSTGSRKVVRLSYDNILSNAQSIAQYLSITADERPITSLPMNYSFGLSIINSHLLQGATLLLTSGSIMQKEFWNLLKTEKATSLSGVPYTYEILKKLRFLRMDLPFLTTMTQAGGKLDIDLNREFTEYCQSANKRFFVMYGQTEATARMSYLPCEQALLKLGSIGTAIPGGEFSLIDENGAPITECDTVGELVYRGRNVSLGYAECGDDLCKGDENAGVLLTGDLAKKDSDNYYYIVGRKKRFIKLFGNRVNLDDTERLLKALVFECACTGSDDRMLVYITESGIADEARKFISMKTGINQSAFVVKQIDSIPRNSSGKIIYSKLDI
ncbi:MAG: AMP-binding protein [Smithella sp.]|jgi:acyl-CoA synthetase (AMP-forming)/AMP-acid ligase II|nr:AMP-binding protein [Bacteroidota bacterium]